MCGLRRDRGRAVTASNESSSSGDLTHQPALRCNCSTVSADSDTLMRNLSLPLWHRPNAKTSEISVNHYRSIAQDSVWMCSYVDAKRWISQKHLQVTFHHIFNIAHFSLLFYSNKMTFLHGDIILMTNKLNPLKLNYHYHNPSRCSIRVMITHKINILYIQCKKSFYYYYQYYFYFTLLLFIL